MQSSRYALSAKTRLNSAWHGSQHIRYSLADCGLEISVALSCKLRLYLLEGLVCNRGIYGHQVDYAVLAFPGANNGVAVGDCAFELANDRILVVE